MQMSSFSPAISVSGSGRLSPRESRSAAGRSIVLEGIAVQGRALRGRRRSALVLLLIAILAD